MAPKATTNVVKATSLWERPEFLMELSIALYQVADFNGVLNPQIRAAIAEYLAAQGHEIGWDAIRQHVQKLRKNRDTNGIQAASAPAAATNAKVPATRKTAATTSRKRRAPAKKAADEGSQDDDDELNLKKEEDDLNDEAVPAPKRATKRVKKEKIEKAPTVVPQGEDKEEEKSGEN